MFWDYILAAALAFLTPVAMNMPDHNPLFEVLPAPADGVITAFSLIYNVIVVSGIDMRSLVIVVGVIFTISQVMLGIKIIGFIKWIAKILIAFI